MGRKYPRKHTSSHNKALVISIRTFSVPSHQVVFRLMRAIVVLAVVVLQNVLSSPSEDLPLPVKM